LRSDLDVKQFHSRSPKIGELKCSTDATIWLEFVFVIIFSHSKDSDVVIEVAPYLMRKASLYEILGDRLQSYD
jgi:hypothetical protein